MSDLLVEQEGNVKHLFLNRPEKRNALSMNLAVAISQAIDEAAHDGTRLIVLQGKGTVFCAGFDFSEFENSSAGDLLLQFVRIEQMLQAVAHSPVDTLALVHGAAIGAGADLLAACRHRIGAPDVQSRFPGARFGLILGSRRLAQCVGADAAQGLIGSPEKINAARMKEIGLLNELLEPSQWPQRMHQVLDQINQVAPQTRAKVLQMMRPDTRAQDMMDLVSSAAQPRVKEQIRAYLTPAKA
jgi:enoyl-CoA hydratase/carnithine racemase